VNISDIVLAAIAAGSVLLTWGITVGLFYAHVAECSRFRVDILTRLTRIEEHLASKE